MWFNEPVPLEYRAGGVGVLLVNERIVEQPYVFAAVAGPVTRRLRILDVGGAESTVGLSLASLGHDVTVVDPRGAVLEHPRLRVIASRMDEVGDDAGPFDVAVALSAIEHFGLEHYTGEAGDARADADAVTRDGGAARAGRPPRADGADRASRRWTTSSGSTTWRACGRSWRAGTSRT